MEYIERILDISKLVHQKSCFLFGPRQTGKSKLLQHTLGEKKIYNLLNQETFVTLNHSPSRIREELTDKDDVIVIDEIQKIPKLLDEVHLIIEEYGVKFLLTGSSARALMRKGVNLLGGRARSYSLHPFVSYELKEHFDLNKALGIGLLPSVYFSDDPWQDLKSYVGVYLREEIAAEAATRNIGAYSRFLEVAALCHGEMINYSEIANDAQIPVSTVRLYFQLLQDTLLAVELPAYKQTQKRKPISTSKFYFFDNGVVRSLLGRRTLEPKTKEYGTCFEAFIFHELNAYKSYKNLDSLSYWRSTSQFEVDFILDNQIAIEVKAKENLSSKDLKGIRALKEEELLKKYIVVTLEPRSREVDGITLLPWREFLDQLWSGGMI